MTDEDILAGQVDGLPEWLRLRHFIFLINFEVSAAILVGVTCNIAQIESMDLATMKKESCFFLLILVYFCFNVQINDFNVFCLKYCFD